MARSSSLRALAPAHTAPAILLVEDSEDDARLIARLLARAGLPAVHEPAPTLQALRAVLARQAWDAVVCDYELGEFNGLDVLRAVLEGGRDIPFILVSGAIDAQRAVEMMKAGAHDYVAKQDLARLAPALARELEAARQREAQRAAQRELALNEQRLRAIIDTEPECVKIVSRDGALLEMNPAGLAMLQAGSIDELRGRALIEFVAEEHRAAFADLHRRVMAGETAQLEFEVLGLRGARRCLDTRAAPLRGEDGAVAVLLGITRDVTERKRAEERLRASESLQRAILESSLDCIVAMDHAGRIVEFSPAAETTFGYPRAEALGQPLAALIIPPELREAHGRGLANFLACGRGPFLGRRVEVQAMRADGSRFPAELAVSQVRAGATPLFTAFIRDISERKRADERIRRMNRVYAVLSGAKSAIARVRDRDELVREICRVAVDAGELRMAWVGLVDNDAGLVRPVAAAGAVGDFLERAPLAMFENRPDGQGLAGRALRARTAMISNDAQADPQILTKHEYAERGIHSVAVIPLGADEAPSGVLALYASERGAFDEAEMRLLNELAGDVSLAMDRLAKEQRLNYLAYYDPLTGLANRTLFHERLSQEIDDSKREGRPAALVLVDLERFKAVNDALGRQAGDELLRQVAARLREGGMDPKRSARVAGDVFAIFADDFRTPAEIARRLEEYLRRVFGAAFPLAGTELRVAARFGVALFPSDGKDGEALFRNAEAALKKAKATGERYLFYEQQMTARVAEKLSLESRLREAIEREEFVLHYQPKVASLGSAIAGAEALIRWRSRDLGLVAPAQFIPLLEETGLILEVGSWALRRAAGDRRAWVAAGIAAPRMAVNVSAIQLRQADFVEVVEKALRDGADPAGIDLEITESLIMQDIDANIGKLRRLSALGVGLAIDDFGTGYSSLAYLTRLPVSTLKIDRSFIITMLEDPNTMTLVRTIVSLAHSLRLNVVAEGVDAEEQARVLRGMGCDEMQGYLFSKPLALPEMTALLTRR